MNHRILFLLVSIITTSVLSQVGGRSTYQFLNLVTSPRQAALGGKTVSNYDYDPTQALFNPASINPEMDNQLSLNYFNHIGDIKYGSAAYAYLWDRRTQVLHTGITYINYGKFDGYDEFGNPTSSFTGSEVALSFGHARNIEYTNFHVGVNVKFISSKLEQYSSFGGALDIGVMYIYDDWDLHITGVARNIGTQFTPYDTEYESLPFELIFGISQTLQNIPVIGAIIGFFMKLGQLWDEHIAPLFGDNDDREIAHGDGSRLTALQQNQDELDLTQANKPLAPSLTPTTQ